MKHDSFAEVQTRRKFIIFYLRDSTLARYLATSCVRPSVRPSVYHKSVFY